MTFLETSSLFPAFLGALVALVIIFGQAAVRAGWTYWASWRTAAAREHDAATGALNARIDELAALLAKTVEQAIILQDSVGRAASIREAAEIGAANRLDAVEADMLQFVNAHNELREQHDDLAALVKGLDRAGDKEDPAALDKLSLRVTNLDGDMDDVFTRLNGVDRTLTVATDNMQQLSANQVDTHNRLVTAGNQLGQALDTLNRRLSATEARVIGTILAKHAPANSNELREPAVVDASPATN